MEKNKQQSVSFGHLQAQAGKRLYQNNFQFLIKESIDTYFFEDSMLENGKPIVTGSWQEVRSDPPGGYSYTIEW